jgi:Fis family transcriptional regulator
MKRDLEPLDGTPDSPTQHTPHQSVLSQHIRLAVEGYFAVLDGQSADHLYDLVLREVEPPLIRTVLEHCGHNQTRAAQALGVSRSTLRKKMTQYGID